MDFQKIWDFLVKVARIIFKVIIHFKDDIEAWFKERERREKLQQDKDNLAVVLKEKSSSGNHEVINCLYNQRTRTLVDQSRHAQGLEGQSVDSNTQSAFGSKEMIVLQ